MIKLLINFLVLIYLSSCQIQDVKKITKIAELKKGTIINQNNEENKDKSNLINDDILRYIIGDPYFIEGVKYIPEENYNYSEIGLASFYGKELHNIKTINNDLNKVTELLGRHKTLPLPSIVKITNLDNGLFLIIKINDRHTDNSSLVQISRKSAQLLKFYKSKITKVKIEILSDPSKQMKVVTQSMSSTDFNDTIDKSPAENISINEISNNIKDNLSNQIIKQPIEIGFEEIDGNDLYLKIYNFHSYEKIKSTLFELKINHKFSTQKEGDLYSLVIGPLENIDANNLVLSFISKGYKNTEFIIE